MPEAQSELVLEIRRLEGLLLFLDSDGLIRSSEGIGEAGGVEKDSTSGEANAKMEVMSIERLM